MKNIDINKIAVSNKVSFWKKGFIGCVFWFMHVASKNECISKNF